MTLQELIDTYLSWLENEVRLGESAQRTLDYYKDWLPRFADHAGPERPIRDFSRLDLETYKSSWHSVQTVQRLWNWAVDMELLKRSPFRKVKRPPLGQRTRILDPLEEEAMRQHAAVPLQNLLDFMSGTLCRPQEAREVLWEQWDPRCACFVLHDFKAKNRRRDGVRVRPLIPSGALLALVEQLRDAAIAVQGGSAPAGHVLLNQRGLPWTMNALRLAVRKACKRAGLDVGKENIVPYTWRHTAATIATANGVTDRKLADLLGHVDPRMTARYQHLQINHLRIAIDQATRRPERPQPSC